MTTLTELKITKSQIQTLAHNLRALLKQRDFSESEVAEQLGLPVMTIRRIVSGETTDPRISTLKLIADFFEVTIDSLIDTASKATPSTPKNKPLFVPVLDWATAAKTLSIEDLDLTSWQDWHPVILGDQYSENHSVFALKTRPSMQPRFPVGTLLIIDPNETPTDGDIVLVKLKKEKELSLRELVIDPPKWQLQPIIPGSEILFYEKSQHKIVGVVILTMLFARKESISD